jgi:dTMP kinase
MARGKFFVIDGTDGSGKATQTKLLIERMRREGLAMETISFPRYDTPTGKEVRAFLDGKYGPSSLVEPRFASKFYADDRKAAAEEIRTWLEAGRNVIADRYVASNMAHQGCKFADAAERQAFFAWDNELEFVQNGLPRPDSNIILHVPAEVAQGLAAARGKLDGNEADLPYLKKAEQVYLEIAGSFPNFKLIECIKEGKLMSIPEIHELVWTEVKNLMTIPA